MLAVWRDDSGAAGMPEAWQRLTLVLSENFESKELGVIGPNRCGYVKLLTRVIECKPGVFQWHTDAKRARAVIELMRLDVKTSKPAPTLGSKYSPGKSDSAGGQLRAMTSLTMGTDVHSAGQQARFCITHWTDPTSSFLRVVACQGLRALK